MQARVELRRVLDLPPEPTSPSRARRFVTALLDDGGRPQWADAATLAVSELVTNAVLHAHTAIGLTGEVYADHVRVEVLDQSPALPSARAYDDHATTGRGLELVASLTTAHGVDSRGSDGKVVWFCVGDLDEPADERTLDQLLEDWDDGGEFTGEPAAGPTRTVLLRDLPPTLWLAAREHHDAVLRELALLQAAGSLDKPLDLAAVDDARFRIGAALDLEVLAAQERGTATVPLPLYHPGALPAVPGVVDLRVDVPPDRARGFAELQDVLDEGERLAVDGLLLERPGLPEIVALRDWACEQVIAQLAGSPAGRWIGTADVRFTEDVERRPVAGWDSGRVTGAAYGLIAVDDGNRIVALSGPLEQLLGWRADDLVGRRLVSIVPPRFREAHVAGFSRHLSTGDARVLGVELTLPVLRADGTELDCAFLIESEPTRSGRVVYLATITPAA